MSGEIDFLLGDVGLTTRAFWRRHDDEFILDRNRPLWYRNQHTTDVITGEVRSHLETSYGVTSVAAEVSSEEIKSKSLGDHSRTRTGLFLEHRFTPATGWSLVPGATIYHYQDWGWQMWPGLDLGYSPRADINLFVSVGKSFRIPTFTDLFYASPANMGNPDLEPEEATTYDLI